MNNTVAVSDAIINSTVLPTVGSTSSPDYLNTSVSEFMTTTTPLTTITTPLPLKTTTDVTLSTILITTTENYTDSFSRGSVYVTVSSVAASVTLVLVFVILIKVFFFPHKYICNTPKRGSRSSLDDLPPAPTPMQYHVTEYNIYEDSMIKNKAKRNSAAYAKPEIYSTFLNPTFYEDAYEKWRIQEAENVYTTEVEYMSPMPGNLTISTENHDEADYEEVQQDGAEVIDGVEITDDEITDETESTAAMEELDNVVETRLGDGGCPGSDSRWSTVSLVTHDDHDYGRFGKVWQGIQETNEIEYSSA